MRKSVIAKIITCIIAMAICLCAVFAGINISSNPDNFARSVETLDAKKHDVMVMTGICGAASIAVAALPGDSTTPIADKIADLTSGFVIVLCVLYLEKYLLSVFTLIGIGIVIPIACIIWIVAEISSRKGIRLLAARIATFGLVIALIIPISVKITNKVDSIYAYSTDTVAEEIQNIEVETEKIESLDEEVDDNDDDKKSSVIDRLLTSVNNVLAAVKKFGSSMTDAAASLKDKAKEILSSLIEYMVVMIVTSCLIPLIVAFIIIKFIGAIFNVRIDISKTIDDDKHNILRE